MSRRRPATKIATRSVRYVDKTVCGRTLVTATLMSGGNWRVTLTYPAVGVDSLTEDLDVRHEEILDSVQKLSYFVGQHWEMLNRQVVAIRKVRYAQRSARFKEVDDGV